jgi:crotonobetainyl-CoA:carnitine CoA-transferase CaiB-like acyl-CoA transferase
MGLKAAPGAGDTVRAVTHSGMKLLQGIRVLDVTTFLAGPLATRALADLGADVLKVEPPSGDPTRAGWTGEGEPSFYWRALHGGRRSVVLDLGNAQDKDTFLQLASDADVVLENMRPGVTARFGVDGPALRARFPRLVTCAITGFDADEPLAGISATDGPVQAWTGAVELMEGWSGAALPMPVQAGDVAGGAVAAQGVLAALVARSRTGVGSHVQVSLAGALRQWMAVTDRMGTLRPPTTLVLRGSDGDRFLVQTPMRFAVKLLALLGLDPATPRADIAGAAARAVAGEPSAVWLERLWAAGIPAAPVRPLGDGVPPPPWTIDGESLQAAGFPPALGANNGEGWL